MVRYIYFECVFSNDGESHTDFFDLHKIMDSYGFSFFGYYAESYNLKHGAALGNVLYVHRKSIPSEVKGVVKNIW